MIASNTFRTLQDYPKTLPDNSMPGAHRLITIDGLAIGDQLRQDHVPLVSLITVAYNSADTINRTIESVRSQTYRNIEHIIIDGGSSDGTVERIKSAEGCISYWHSRPDKGIADAFNSGIAVSRGQLIGIVNSDDWLSPNQIEEGVRATVESGADFSFGDMAMYSGTTPLFLVKGHSDYKKKIQYGMPPINHPSVLARRTVYEDIGLFDLKWKIAMDYDWLCRCDKAGYNGVYTSRVCANMSDAGVSNNQLLQVYRESWEIVRTGGLSLAQAAPRFIFRYFKTSTRRWLESLIGKTLTGRIRAFTNPRHERHSDSTSDL